jgi:hypothetical protein
MVTAGVCGSWQRGRALPGAGTEKGAGVGAAAGVCAGHGHALSARGRAGGAGERGWGEGGAWLGSRGGRGGF